MEITMLLMGKSNIYIYIYIAKLMGISNPKTLRPLVYANCRAFCFSSQLKNATPSHLLDEPRRSDAAQLERDAESKDM